MILILFIIINRRAAVITEYGLTDTYNIERGVEQGDTISPLLWCIFYDTLMSRIIKTYKGYTIKEDVIKDLRYPENKEILTESIAIMAYMDDTVWISESKYK